MVGPLRLDAATLALLDPARGLLAPPLRATAGVPLPFEAQGARLAAEHGATAPGRDRRPTFMPRLRANVQALHDAHRCIAGQARRGHAVSPAGDWLLDNTHVLAAQTREVHDGLPRSFYRELPVLQGDDPVALPRIFALAWAFVADNDSTFDAVSIGSFLRGYQQAHTQRLSLGELWALPTTLRVVLIENLRRLAERVAAEEAAREAANRMCDGAGFSGADDALEGFARMQRRGVGTAFALQVMQRLHDDADAVTPQGRQGREAVRAALASALPDPDDALLRQQADLAADNHSVAQAVRALQGLGTADWRRIVGQASNLVQVLMGSPCFAAERDDTQDISLHAVERLARRSGRDETDVGTLLLALMQRPGTDTGAPTQAAGHWTTGPGRAELESALGLHDGPWRRAAAWTRAHALGLYVTALGSGSAALAVAFVATAARPDIAPWALALCTLLALWPASEVVSALLHRLCGEWAPPRQAPRLALADGIPPDQRVLVVVPALLTHADGIRALVARLEQHHLANRESYTQWALLTDWADAASASTPADAALLETACAAIDALDLRHRGSDANAPRRFLLLHRPRRWSISEQAWIGWERKRGKLEELIAVLADPAAGSPFVDLGVCSRPHRPCTHVLTLDSDTTLPPGTLRELVAVAAHPLNQPRIDAERRCVVAGHAVLQPRVDIAWPVAGEATPYHRLWAGAWGHDPYNAASSEVFSDLFDEASFSGKGLLHVAALHAVLAARLPEGQVLSHDLLEGAIARCGGVSDVRLLEPAASHPDMAAARLHRWTRGDWQLLPLLLHPRRYGLGALGRWRMLDNLRRPLVAPLSLLLLALALAGWGVSPQAALALGAAAFGAGALLSAVAGLAPSRDDLALRHFLRVAGAEMARALAGIAWQVALWPRLAATQLSAIALALWRTGVSRHHLLQWTSSDAAGSAAGRGWRGVLRRHALAPPLALLAFWALPGGADPIALALCLLWGGTPLWVWWAGRASTGHLPALAADDRVYLQALARDTWRFFEQHVGAQSHHLPPDNVQTLPHSIVAQRTSPTNIGLYLLSLATARAFDWIGSEDWVARCEATLSTIDRLPRHRGHVLNWIDKQTLQALPPAYVSVVDSGNLCVHLLAVAAALDEEAGGQPRLEPGRTRSAALRRDLQLRLQQAAARCRALAAEPEFGFLYNARRRLFHIGWRVEEQQADAGHYDLLASEARAASLWAIAKGDVPATHWSALGRPLQAEGAQVGLRSWSGSMFEYLMPALVLEEPPGTLLASASRMAVNEQRRFGNRLGLPWGFSECARAEVDASLAYQYGPQGAPSLAMRRTPEHERVVAPYATAMAVMIDPAAAVANLRRLEALGARGRMGFIEALDFTAERRPEPSRCALVQTTMAHHQGMTLVALAVVLLDGLPRRWGMADPQLAAVACLLHERIPREVARIAPVQVEYAPQSERGPAAGDAARRLRPGASALPPTQLLSNGRYAVALRPNGAGFSRFGGADITRWRDDALRDAFGSFVFLRRAPDAAPVSITQHPAPDSGAEYSARFGFDNAVFSATWPDLRVLCTVWVDATADVEYRCLELWNTSARPLALELLSAFELCLSPARADEMHPAFANLFVSAHWHADTQSLVFMRKPRRDDESALHAAHFIVQAEVNMQPVRAVADRTRWRGRLRGAWQPLADFADADADDGPRVTGLDPVAALSLRLTLPPHGTTRVVLGTAAATDAARLAALVLQARVTLPASELRLPPVAGAEPTLQGLGEITMSADERARLQTLATPLLLTLAKPSVAFGPSVHDRHGLWRLGLSGERPLISVHISQPQGLRMVRALMRGLAWWARGGLAVDLVVLNHEPRSYLMTLQHDLLALRERHQAAASSLGARTPAGAGAMNVWLASDLSADERASLTLLARVRLQADGRPLAQHLAELMAWHDAALAERDDQHHTPLSEAPWPQADIGPAPVGLFDADDGSFAFDTHLARPTPRPWVNVLANPGFGTLVSEAAGSCTWADNSRLHQLSAWGNDTLGDMDGETFAVQDLRTRQVWQLGRALGGQVQHGIGFSRLSQTLPGGLRLTATWSVAPEHAIKRIQLTLHNPGVRALELRVAGLVEWLMGSVRGDRRSVSTAFVSPGPGAPAVDLLLATQHDAHDGRAGHSAFLAVHVDGSDSARLDDWTCDRRELFDARGRPVLPEAFGQRAGAGLDPCAAIGVALRLPAGGSAGCVFVIGHAATRQAAVALAGEQVMNDARQAEAGARAHWQALLGGVRVHTPDAAFDAMVNHWLPYQTVACRLWGRAGFYQAGGAYGYRDQLQDAMALAVSAPQLLREHLLRAAARQFVEGDVQHWWHAGSGAGVRTHFSDDRLWLPHATLHYLRVTRDAAVLDVEVPFIEGDAVPPGAEDAYFTPRISAQRGSLFEHVARAIDRSLPVGVHGLPLMGGGDWNDGMNRVGNAGRGESVWLAWFLCDVVAGWAPLAHERGEVERAATWQAAARGWRLALGAPAWDGQWYRRAFFDDGTALGSGANTECRIDLIAQAWSVLSGAASAGRQHQAMASAQALLADESLGLLRLLDPPLAHAVPSAGYIQAYPPGVRENGGQYAHGAVWAAMAQARLGDADGAFRTWCWLSPAHRAADPRWGPAYGLEPYVMAADVYSQPPYAGRGGWSWYTGSAAGMHRAALESICGLEVSGTRLRLRPRLPSHWPTVTIELRLAGRGVVLILCAAQAAQAIAQARSHGLAPGPSPLGEGQWLDVATQRDGSHHLLICGTGTPGPQHQDVMFDNEQIGPQGSASMHVGP